MLTATKIDLPDSLLQGAMMYATELRKLLTKEQAVEAAGLRDYAQLLVAMGDADLPMPTLSQAEIDSQAQTFANLLTT